MQRQSAKDPPRNNKKKDGSKEFFKNLGTVLTENSEKIRELVHNTIVVPPRNGKRGNRPKTTNGRAEEKPSTAGSSEKPVPEGSNKPAPEESSGPDRPTSPSRPRSQPSTGSSERPRAEETHKSSAKPADTGTASSGQPSAKEGSKPSSPDSHTFYFDDGDAVDPEQYFENDVDPEQYFDDDIDLDWSAATAHIDDYDVPPTSSTTLPDNDETTPLAGKYEDKEFCDKYDEVDYDHKHEDVDQDWLAATSCIPDVDVPPECAEEDVEDVWVDGEGEKGSDAYNDVAAEEGDIQKNVLSDEELAADQNEDVDEAQREARIADMVEGLNFEEEHFIDDEVSELGHTTILPAGGEINFAIMEELERLRAIVNENGLHIPTTLPADEASVRTTPLM